MIYQLQVPYIFNFQFSKSNFIFKWKCSGHWLPVDFFINFNIQHHYHPLFGCSIWATLFSSHTHSFGTRRRRKKKNNFKSDKHEQKNPMHKTFRFFLDLPTNSYSFLMGKLLINNFYFIKTKTKTKTKKKKAQVYTFL